MVVPSWVGRPQWKYPDVSTIPQFLRVIRLYPPTAGCSWLQVPWGCTGQDSVQYSDSPLILLFSFMLHSFPSPGLVLVSISGQATHPIPCWAGGRVAAHMSQMETETRVLFCFKRHPNKEPVLRPPSLQLPPSPKQAPLPKPIRGGMGQGTEMVSFSFSALQRSCYSSICFHIYTLRATCSCLLPLSKIRSECFFFSRFRGIRDILPLRMKSGFQYLSLKVTVL